MTEPTLFDSLAFVERIESLMKDSESVDVEFKSAKGGFPGSFWETYSAFANSQGGTIIFGVKEKDGNFSIDHLTQKEIVKYKKEFWNNVNNKQCVSANILKDNDVQEGEYEGSFVLVFNIPRANRSQKPVYLKNSPDNTYKRNYEGDYKCSPDEVRRMFADADTEHPKDSRILEGFTIEEDIDKESLNQYRQRFASIRPDHPWLLLDDKGLLTKLKGYRIDKISKQEGLTLSGLLMFGKYDSIKDPDCCPAYFPDYREYFSTNPEDRWTDRIYPDGTWEANLFQFYTRVYPRLSAVLPKPFALKNGIRVEDTPTHIALREAFVNTLIHCDYTVDSNITIELHRDRYIFSNPGSLLISIHQYYQGGDSVCRNKSLQQMFMHIGSAETAGSGVNKILQGWKEANFRSPQVEEKINPDKVVLELPLVSLLSTEVIDYLKELFGDKIESIEHDKLLTLATCCSEGEVTNYRLQLVIDKHSTEITRLLKELCNDQYLIAYGVGRGTRYRINEDFGAGISTNDASNSARPTNSASNDASQIAIKRTRLNTSTLQQLILDVCSNYLSIDEIAERVHKSLHHLKNNIIPKMVSTGLLEREFPNAPKHPNQRYRAKAK